MQRQHSMVSKARQNHHDTFGQTQFHAKTQRTMHTHGSLCKLKLDTTLLYLRLDTSLCKETKKHAHSRLTMQAQTRHSQPPCKLSARTLNTKLILMQKRKRRKTSFDHEERNMNGHGRRKEEPRSRGDGRRGYGELEWGLGEQKWRLGE